MYYSQLQTVIILYGISLVNGQLTCLCTEMEPLPYDPTEWIYQPVDHFNDSDSRNFTMKYYKIMKYWKPEGPILLFLQGDADLPPPIIGKALDGDDSRYFVNEIAKETSAALFLLEHRYFGESTIFDFNDLSVETLAFLNSRQALADVFQVLTTIKKTPEFQNSKVIVVGGSYGGNLAVWLKQMYPEFIDAVLASSAALLAKVDFKESYESITDTFRTYGSQECVDKITEIFKTYLELFQTPEGIAKLKLEYAICDYVNMTNPLNQQYFFDFLSYFFYRYVYTSIPADIDTVCQGIMSNELDQMLFNKNDGLWTGFGYSCISYDLEEQSSMIVQYGKLFLREEYQTCNEFADFDTGSSGKQMFGNITHLDYFVTSCKLLFGEEFNEERIEQGVNNLNRMFGGLTPNVTNVVFVNGDMDPMHRLSIVQDLSADAPAIFIKGASTCSELHKRFDESDNVKEARKRIKSLLKKWIGQV